MTIDQIIQARKGSAGSGGAWRVVRCNDTAELWHYSTRMLRWRDTGYGIEVLNMSTGYGSVSDQGGMNRAFRALGLPYRFERAGGAGIVNWQTNERVI